MLSEFGAFCGEAGSQVCFASFSAGTVLTALPEYVRLRNSPGVCKFPSTWCIRVSCMLLGQVVFLWVTSGFPSEQTTNAVGGCLVSRELWRAVACHLTSSHWLDWLPKAFWNRGGTGIGLWFRGSFSKLFLAPCSLGLGDRVLADPSPTSVASPIEIFCPLASTETCGRLWLCGIATDASNTCECLCRFWRFNLVC